VPPSLAETSSDRIAGLGPPPSSVSSAIRSPRNRRSGSSFAPSSAAR